MRNGDDPETSWPHDVHDAVRESVENDTAGAEQVWASTIRMRERALGSLHYGLEELVTQTHSLPLVPTRGALKFPFSRGQETVICHRS